MSIRFTVFAVCAAAPLAAQISHTHLGTFPSTNLSGEIAAFDPGSNRFFVTNSVSQSLSVYQMSATGSAAFVQSIPLGGLPNSVAVKNGLVAAAVEGATGQAAGSVKFFDAATGAANGATVTVGAMPDMLIFTPDGSKVLTANEGEADLATGLINPEGSVSIVDVASRIAVTASFAPWNGQKAALQAQGVRIVNNNGITLAQDLEPEYLVINDAGTTAHVTLQEANAIAEIDIATATVTQIRPLGFKDHGVAGNEFDASNSDGINGNFVNHPVYGLQMPDAITSFTINGVTYLATANEGDSRADFLGFRDETRGASLAAGFVLDAEDPTPETGVYTLAQLNNNAVLGRLNFATSTYDIARGDTDGDGDVDRLYAFGGRSFTLWTTAGVPVFDSGSQIEREMLARGLWNESRSDDKGPEPEAVTFGVVDGVPLLFVGLERTNAVMVYNVANPAAPALVDVINVTAASGIASTAPEGLLFIRASDNATGRALLAVTTEGNGATSVFAINAGAPVAQTFGTGCPANQPLALASNLPQLNNAWTLSASNASVNAPFCTFWFGAGALVAPVDLTALGAPGCFARIDTSFGAVLAPATGGASSYVIQVPATPALLTFAIAAQATTFDGSVFAVSNGLAAVVGN